MTLPILACIVLLSAIPLGLALHSWRRQREPSGSGTPVKLTLRRRRSPGETRVTRDPFLSLPTPPDLPPAFRLGRPVKGSGTPPPLAPGKRVAPAARPSRLTVAFFFWPTLTAEHLATGRSELQRAYFALREQLGLDLSLVAPAQGRLVQGDPAVYGLQPCDPAGAYAHLEADVTVIFKPLVDATGQPRAVCAGVSPTASTADDVPLRFANVDVSLVLAGAKADPEEKLYQVILHALLGALARVPTKHSDGWGGVFLVPTADSAHEYLYPSAYGPTPEGRAQATAEGWRHFNTAILEGTARRYVPHLDGPRPVTPPARAGVPT